MEEDPFKPGEVYLYLVEWDDGNSTIKARALEEYLTLGDLRGGGLNEDYKKYYLGMKYMIYCEDANGNLVMHSFAVDYRAISWGFSDAFKKFEKGNPKPNDLKDDGDWNELKNHPGFNVPDGQIVQYQNKVDEMRTNHSQLAEIAFDQKIAPIVVNGIMKAFYEETVEKYLTPKCLAFSDIHGSVLSYTIGIRMMMELKGKNDDLITVCEGDVIGRKGNYYEGERERDGWNEGKFPDLTSTYIIHHVRKLVEAEGSKFIYLHGNHDYAIEYPTIMSYTTINYQLIFTHGMIHPQLLRELQDIEDGDEALIYPKSLVGVPEVKIFAFSKDSIARADPVQNKLFSNDDGKLLKILDERNERPEDDQWNEKVDSLKKLQTRDYLSNYFFIMANKLGYGSHQTVAERTLEEMNEALKMLYEFAVGALVNKIFNPIFTFGHDYSYEVWSYYAYLEKYEENKGKHKFPLNELLWLNDYDWGNVKGARFEKHLMARVFCVDGLHYINPSDYNENGPYAKINKYQGNLEGLKQAGPDEDVNEAHEEEEEEESSLSETAADANSNDNFIIIERELENNNKSVSFIRGMLHIYNDSRSALEYMHENYVIDHQLIGSETFKLIFVIKGEETNDIYELFFEIPEINDLNRNDIVNAITETLKEWFEGEKNQPSFFIFSPSIHTLECFQGVLRCMDTFSEAYFIAASSPLSGMKDEMENESIEKAKKIIAEYKLNDKDKYIELLDLEVEDSYKFKDDGWQFKQPVAIEINLSNVNILVSKHIRSLNEENVDGNVMEVDGAQITKYYYNLGKVAEKVNKLFENAPAIPMTKVSLINLIKKIFVKPFKAYELIFKPTEWQHIITLQSSLKKWRKMEPNNVITISTADVKWDQNSAIHNLADSLSKVLNNPDFSKVSEEALITFFPNGSNPLILTSDICEVYEGNEEQPLGEFIMAYDDKCEEMAKENFLLSRTYSLYGDRQKMLWKEVEQNNESSENSEPSDSTSDKSVSDDGDGNDDKEETPEPGEKGTAGGVVPSKKAIIISIILGAILIVVIVIIIIVTSRDEGFKPSMRQIKY